MKLSIGQKEFSKLLTTVQKAVSSRTTIPILTGILIEAVDNKLICTATDLELGITSFEECKIIEEGSIVVDSKLLGDFVRKFPSNSEINLETVNNKIFLKSLNSDISIMGKPSNEYPKDTFDNDGNKIKINSTILKKLIKYTTFAASNKDDKPIFNGCLLDIKNNKCNLVALDGYRMAVKSDEIICDENINIIIPSKSLSEISRLLEDNECEIELIISKSHISFVFGNTILISNLLEGKFLDYNNLIKDDISTKIVLNTINFKESMERASLLTRLDSNNLIIFDIKDDKIEIKSVSDSGNVDEINILKKKEGNDIRIGFNSNYIIDVLKIIESEFIELNFMGNVNPCFIKECDDNNYVYMVLPVKIS